MSPEGLIDATGYNGSASARAELVGMGDVASTPAGSHWHFFKRAANAPDGASFSDSGSLRFRDLSFGWQHSRKRRSGGKAEKKGRRYCPSLAIGRQWPVAV